MILGFQNADPNDYNDDNKINWFFVENLYRKPVNQSIMQNIRSRMYSE